MSRDMPRFRYHSKKIISQTKSLSLLEKGYASLLVNGVKLQITGMSFTCWCTSEPMLVEQQFRRICLN